jgi:hypothetical protein
MKIKDIIIIILIALIGYFVFIRKGKSSHSSSLIIEEIHDTIIRYDTVKIKRVPLDTFYKTIRDTFIKEGTYSINEYEYNINDSLLVGTIFATSPIKPSIKLEYTLKSYNIKDSTVIREPLDHSGLFYGGSVLVKPFATEIYFDAAKSFKNGNQINVSIGRNFEIKQTVFKIGFLKKF